MRRLLVLTLLLPGVIACEADHPRGLTRSARPGEVPGPTVLFQPLIRPQPEIPFPNDLLLTVGADGKRHWNVSTDSTTRNEATTREHLDDIEGFSGLTPISLAFDAPLDVSSVTDKTVFVVNVTPQDPHAPDQANPRFGERVPLDLGRGWFPQSADPHEYLPLDPLKNFNSYVLPPDNRIDTDGDGVPDKWVYHYEVASHTLDLRPLVPLQAGAQYAVVLTRGIKGWSQDGTYGPIRSPWEWVNHDSQTAALERALPSLEKAGIHREDVAFAWTLTIGDLARTFTTLRDGLYGKGPFAWLATEFPAKIREIDDLGIPHDGNGTYPKDAPLPAVPGDSVYVLQATFLQPIVGLIKQLAPDVGINTVEHVSHAVFGSYDTVNLRATPDNVWRLDVRAGTVDVDKAAFHEKIPFMLTVPKTTAAHKPPFPVTIHAHATGTSRIEALLLADKLAEAGIATFAIDAVGHGPILTDPVKLLNQKDGAYLPLARALLGNMLYFDPEKELPESMSDSDALTKMLKNGFVQELAVKGRAVDDNGNCVVEAGEAYYAPDAFRLRDAMRQTTLDYIVAVRMLHELSQKAVPPKPTFDPHTATAEQLQPHLLAGDFDLDGVLDVGGDVPYFMTGVSLGGIHTALTAPLEPFIVAAAPVVPGAGLADVFVRTRLHDKVTPLMQVVSGPMLIGCPAGKDAKTQQNVVHLSWNDDSNKCQQTTRQTWKDPQTGICLDHQVEESIVQADLHLAAGATLVLTNLRSGEQATTVAAADGSFRVAVPSDEGDRLTIQVLGGGQAIVAQAQVVTPYKGLARQRNTPDFRHFVQLAANVLEGADAITVADRVLLEPLAGHPRTNLLMMLATNDKTVPFTQGVALARAMGLFGRPEATSAQARQDLTSSDAAYLPWTVAAIASGLLNGEDVPPPVLDPTHPEGGDGLCHLIPTDPAHPEGPKSGLCLANVHGHHEYIAQPNADDSFGTIPADPAHPASAPYKGTYTEYHRNLIVTYLHSLGKHVAQDPCWGDATCIGDRHLRDEWALPVGEVK